MRAAAVVQVMSAVALRCGYSCVRAYLTAHLPYLLKHWLRSGRIADFPFQLLDYPTLSLFYT